MEFFFQRKPVCFVLLFTQNITTKIQLRYNQSIKRPDMSWKYLNFTFCDSMKDGCKFFGFHLKVDK